MLLTITNKTSPACDLSFLLHKQPDHLQHFSLSYGGAHVFYPEADTQRCTVALLLDINPVMEIRGRGRNKNRTIDTYVNDRPYVCSSFMSTAIAKVFGTAMGGRSKQRQQMADTPLDLEASLSVVPCRGGPNILDRLFAPLGYQVEAIRYPLDPQFPPWGESPYYTLKIAGKKLLRDLLTHLFVLIPVLDFKKHYFIGKDEVEKLIHKGRDWLPQHPEKELITRRYFINLQSLARAAMSRLLEEDASENERLETLANQHEEEIEHKVHLNETRLNTVQETLRRFEVHSVADLGCGEGKFLKQLLREKALKRILGVDVSVRSLEIASKRLHLENMSDRQRERISLIQGSLMYKDSRFAGFDAITLIEVIEHMELNRLGHLERVVFECAAPRVVVVTTPNVEYNVLFENLPQNKMRHSDHRFEWTRSEFEAWAKPVAERFGYHVEFQGIGPVDSAHGAPTQMAVFYK